jgi:hypothetical protein
MAFQTLPYVPSPSCFTTLYLYSNRSYHMIHVMTLASCASKPGGNLGNDGDPYLGNVLACVHPSEQARMLWLRGLRNRLMPTG